MSDYKYNRVLLKLSGEALAGNDGHGLDQQLVDEIANEVKKIADGGVEVAIVIGGGNIIRGAQQEGMNRENADYMGMLATIINSMGLAEGFRKVGLSARVMSAIPIDRVCDPYHIRDAKRHLKNGEIVILGGGTGAPYFTTDTTATLRASELNCDCVLKATKVDGVYDDDPMKNPDAKRFEKISYAETLERGLAVMDQTAVSMAQTNNIPVIVFNIFDKDSVLKVLKGESVGTVVS